MKLIRHKHNFKEIDWLTFPIPLGFGFRLRFNVKECTGCDARRLT